MKKVIYFAYLECEGSKHDRSERFEKGTEPCFFEWLQKSRESIEEKQGKSAVIVNCNIFEH